MNDFVNFTNRIEVIDLPMMGRRSTSIVSEKTGRFFGIC